MPHAWESNWILGDRLGKGGQGVTHVATRVGNSDEMAALKYLKNNKDPQARRRMHREVASLQSLAAEGGTVPRVLDHNTDRFEESSVELYVAMEIILGPTLQAHVEQSALSIDASIACLLSMSETVRLAHTFPIVHRDLKPDNVVLRNGDSNTPVLVDYGLSFNASLDNVTQTGEMFQNRFLTLPETSTPTGDRRDPRSDLTALCGLLYFCLTGHVPGHLHDSNGALPHMRRGYSLRDRLKDERIPYLEEFLTRGFASNIDNRFQRVEDITSQLTAILESNRSEQELDPIKLATAINKQVRAFHRPTQLAEQIQNAQPLFAAIQQDSQQFRDKLPGFEFAAVGGFRPPRAALPAGSELVAHCSTNLSLKAANHVTRCSRHFAVASIGDRCILLACDQTSDSSNDQLRHGFALEPSNPSFEGAWQQIASYEGSPKQIEPLVIASNKQWLIEQLKILKAEMLPDSGAGRPPGV